MKEVEHRNRQTKKQWVMFAIGLAMLIAGISIAGFFVIRKVVREINKRRLMTEHIMLTIPELDIKAPVLEGTDNETLSKAVGHFPETGALGEGNYCIAGHSSPIDVEYFNGLADAAAGMEIQLYDTVQDANAERPQYVYEITEMFYVQPNELWVIGDFGDDRLTLVTCNDDGSERLIVVAQYPNRE